MKIKLDWLITVSIKLTISTCEKYEIINYSIEFDHSIPQLVLEGTQEQLRTFVFEFYNVLNSNANGGTLDEEDFWDCVIKN
jgi:hypothetical protein